MSISFGGFLQDLDDSAAEPVAFGNDALPRTFPEFYLSPEVVSEAVKTESHVLAFLSNAARLLSVGDDVEMTPRVMAWVEKTDELLQRGGPLTYDDYAALVEHAGKLSVSADMEAPTATLSFGALDARSAGEDVVLSTGERFLLTSITNMLNTKFDHLERAIARQEDIRKHRANFEKIVQSQGRAAAVPGVRQELRAEYILDHGVDPETGKEADEEMARRLSVENLDLIQKKGTLVGLLLVFAAQMCAGVLGVYYATPYIPSTMLAVVFRLHQSLEFARSTAESLKRVSHVEYDPYAVGPVFHHGTQFGGRFIGPVDDRAFARRLYDRATQSSPAQLMWYAAKYPTTAALMTYQGIPWLTSEGMSIVSQLFEPIRQYNTAMKYHKGVDKKLQAKLREKERAAIEAAKEEAAEANVRAAEEAAAVAREESRQGTVEDRRSLALLAAERRALALQAASERKEEPTLANIVARFGSGGKKRAATDEATPASEDEARAYLAQAMKKKRSGQWRSGSSREVCMLLENLFAFKDAKSVETLGFTLYNLFKEGHYNTVKQCWYDKLKGVDPGFDPKTFDEALEPFETVPWGDDQPPPSGGACSAPPPPPIRDDGEAMAIRRRPRRRPAEEEDDYGCGPERKPTRAWPLLITSILLGMNALTGGGAAAAAGSWKDTSHFTAAPHTQIYNASSRFEIASQRLEVPSGADRASAAAEARAAIRSVSDALVSEAFRTDPLSASKDPFADRVADIAKDAALLANMTARAPPEVLQPFLGLQLSHKPHASSPFAPAYDLSPAETAEVSGRLTKNMMTGLFNMRWFAQKQHTPVPSAEDMPEAVDWFERSEPLRPYIPRAAEYQYNTPAQTVAGYSR